MRLAVFADVHGNLTAFEAVLNALDQLERDAPTAGRLCLGDAVGYYPEADSVLRLLRKRIRWNVAGNHDHRVLGTAVPGTTSESARFTHEWTSDALSGEDLDFLREQPNIVVEDEFSAVHGCYLNPDHYYGYITGTMIEENLHRLAQSTAWPQLAFCGHTHLPSVVWLEQGQIVEKVLSGTIAWPAHAEAVIINPGAVGQPRDKNPHAAFAIVDTGKQTATGYRIPYDIRKTQAAVHAAGFPEALALRLNRGT